MNARSFIVIFSKRLDSLVAVGENATAQSKSASGEATLSASGLAGAASSAAQHLGVLKHICLAALMGSATQAFGLDANALPTGAVLHHGAASVGTEGATMTINQTSSRATINWQSFNVGEKARVNVVQNDSQSVLLNRVVGNDMSQIRGQISANGQVILVNPNGIVMGPTGRITASAFTASTFGISDTHFEACKMKYERNGSNGKVVHQGHIQTTEAGGYVALIGAEVSNEGTIHTRQGAVVLAAADAFVIPVTPGFDENKVSVLLSSSVRLEIDPAAFGSASVSNSGVIQTEGGQVLLRAAALVDAVSKVAAARVTHTGSIDTTGEQGGRVDILADQGHVRVSGNVKANSTKGGVGGKVFIGRNEQTNVLAAVGDASGARLESKGGFVETSGSHLKTTGTRVLAKDWLLDPSDITISNSPNNHVTGTSPDDITPTGTGTGTSIVQVSTIVDAINQGTNVTIKTTNDSNPNGAGNITIADALTFNNIGPTEATLSLIADNGIIQNAAITTHTDSKLVHIKMDAKGDFNGDPAAHAYSEGLTLNSTITTNGDVTLIGTNKNTRGGFSKGGVVFNGDSGITARNITVKGKKKNSAHDANGIAFSGTTTFNSTGESLFEGKSAALGNAGAGIFVADRATLNINSGAGTVLLTGENTNPGERAIRLGFVDPAATTININNNASDTGKVTFGSETSTRETFLRANLNVNHGTLSMQGGEVQLYQGAVLTAKDGTTVNMIGNTVNLGQAGLVSVKSDAGSGFDLNISANNLNIQSAASVDVGTGSATLKTRAPAQDIVIGQNDTNGRMGLTQAELNLIKASNLVIGDVASKGNIAVAMAVTTAAATGNLTLQTGGNISVDEALTVGEAQATKNLVLNAAGEITQSSKGVIRANHVRTAGAKAAVKLGTAINQINQLTASVKSLHFKNGKELQIGANNEGITASEKIKIETTTGNLKLDQAVITTTEGESNAVILISESKKGFGQSDGGNILKGSQGSVSVGNGSTAKLYTGSVADSTGMQAIAGGSGSGRYRYNSDEGISNYSKDLSSGVNVIYREKPTIAVTVKDVTQIMNNVQFSGGEATLDGGSLRNGDSLSDALTFGGTAQGAVSEGIYTIEGKSESSALGYSVTYKNGKLTINAEPITPPAPLVPVPVTPATNPNVVVTLAPATNNNFVLAGAEGQCRANTLEQCGCKKAGDTWGASPEGIQICYEPKRRSAASPL